MTELNKKVKVRARNFNLFIMPLSTELCPKDDSASRGVIEIILREGTTLRAIGTVADDFDFSSQAVRDYVVAKIRHLYAMGSIDPDTRIYINSGELIN